MKLFLNTFVVNIFSILAKAMFIIYIDKIRFIGLLRLYFRKIKKKNFLNTILFEQR